MHQYSYSDLWGRLTAGDESVLIEAKRASQAGKSIFETISAFSNEPGAGGGYFLFGVGPKEDSLFPDYEVIGVPDCDKLQCDLATQCRDSFSSVIRPEFSIEYVGNKIVVVMFIPEAQAHDKPVFIKSKGSMTGSFRRIGSTDQTCTEDDLALFYQERGHKTYDENVISGTSIKDIEPEALAAYRTGRRTSSGGESEILRLSDIELLYALNAIDSNTANARLTLGGLVLFGTVSALRRNLPMTRVDYIRVDGREWIADAQNRFQSVEKLGPLLLVIPQLISQILDDIPKSFSLSAGDVFRKEMPLIPRKVIREAVVNSLMHRNYRSSQPVQIIRYANRIEIKNPGYSLIPEERLGEPGSKSRNPKIAATLHDAGLAETMGTGIRVMREAMDQSNLTAPLIVSDRKKDEFTLRLLVHHLYGPEDLKWLATFKDCKLQDDETRALMILREIGFLDNVSYRTVNHVDPLTASRRLARLRDCSLLEQQGTGASTYYTPGPRITGEKAKKRRKTQSLRQELPDTLRQELESLRQELPDDLAESLDSLGQRTPPSALNDMIHRLCSWRPLGARELALLLNRHEEHITKRNIKRLMSEGRLEYFYKDHMNHPYQKYIPAADTIDSAAPSPAAPPHPG